MFCDVRYRFHVVNYSTKLIERNQIVNLLLGDVSLESLKFWPRLSTIAKLPKAPFNSVRKEKFKDSEMFQDTEIPLNFRKFQFLINSDINIINAGW